eukprot:gene20508-23296_t
MSMQRVLRTAGLLLSVLRFIVLLADAASPTASPTPPPTLSPTAVLFTYTGSFQAYTVPTNAAQIKVTLFGASGGTAASDSQGGKGAKVECTFAASPNNPVLYFFIGGQGSYGVTSGGFNDGGDSTYSDSCSGGGATDVRTSQSATSYSTRIAVAGGGGGGDGYCDDTGGYGGYPSGSTGGTKTCTLVSTSGGSPGNQTTGGPGGSRSGSGTGLAGVLGKGGKGCSAGGAGGGGGYFGGGGTCGGGGGGGSSYCSTVGGIFVNGTNVGNGYAIVDYIVAPTATPTTVPTANPSTKPITAPTVTPTLRPDATANPTVSPTVIPSCLHGWILGGVVCYKMAPAMTESGDVCSDYCTTNGGTLPCVASAAQNEMIRSITGSAKIWLGYKSTADGVTPPFNYQWISSCDSTYNNMSPTQTSGMYAQMRLDGLWAASNAPAQLCLCQMPGMLPSMAPVAAPTPSPSPSRAPTTTPTAPSMAPTEKPTLTPSVSPSVLPTLALTTSAPSCAPTYGPTTPYTVQFNYTGNVQLFYVPQNAVSMLITAVGAGGASSGSAPGGAGGEMRVRTFDITAGAVLYINVGSRGMLAASSGGYNGGGGGTCVQCGAGGG